MATGSGEDSELVYTPEALRAIDRAAVDRYGIPSIVLMENAARGLAQRVLDVLGPAGGPVLIVCGKGNNGGDGLACARHLHNAGVRVEVVLVEPTSQTKMSDDGAANLRIVRAMGLPVREGWRAEVAPPEVVVDALLGTGIRGTVSGPLAAAIDGINELGQRGAAVVAADLPSGMDATTGRGLATGRTPAVRAGHTVTFVGVKPGFLTPEGRALVGTVEVVGIGCPVELLREFGVPRGLGGGGGGPT